MSMASVYLCDSDRLYLGRLHGFLRERIRLPLRWMEYTDASRLPVTGMNHQNDVLLIAGKDADPAWFSFFRAVLVLAEQDVEPEEEGGSAPEADKNGCTVLYVSRYQRASVIAEHLLALLTLVDGNLSATGKNETSSTHVTAYYTPLGRCMQTSMAIASGQILSAGNRALYIGFDTFPVSALTAEGLNGDITDLLYYADIAKEKLPVHLERIRRKIGNLEYIPPARSAYRMQGADGAEMVAFLRTLCTVDRPEHLLLDLTQQTPGLTDILSFADTVITITGHDRTDAEKIECYKRWLAENGMEHILEKTTFCKLPSQCKLPPSLHQLMTSGLGTYIKKHGLLPHTAGRGR